MDIKISNNNAKPNFGKIQRIEVQQSIPKHLKDSLTNFVKTNKALDTFSEKYYVSASIYSKENGLRALLPKFFSIVDMKLTLQVSEKPKNNLAKLKNLFFKPKEKIADLNYSGNGDNLNIAALNLTKWMEELNPEEYDKHLASKLDPNKVVGDNGFCIDKQFCKEFRASTSETLKKIYAKAAWVKREDH